MAVLERYTPIIDDAEAFLAACERPLAHTVRVNTIKISVGRARAALDAAGIDHAPVGWHPELLEVETDAIGTTLPYFLGWLHGQEEVSAVPPMILDPTAGDRIWDACASPGSKASQIAARMDDDGLLVANDVDLDRLAPLRANLERLGVTACAVTHHDARNYSLEPFAFEAFDAALVDAPCSGEGTVRKQPDALDDWSEAFLESAARLQVDILRRAVQATKPGGTVVYSTCTFAPEENEAVLDAVLAAEACRLVEFDLPLETAPGLTRWRGEVYDGSLAKTKRIYPHLNDTGGFFCAKLEVGA